MALVIDTGRKPTHDMLALGEGDPSPAGGGDLEKWIRARKSIRIPTDRRGDAYPQKVTPQGRIAKPID